MTLISDVPLRHLSRLRLSSLILGSRDQDNRLTMLLPRETLIEETRRDSLFLGKKKVRSSAAKTYKLLSLTLRARQEPVRTTLLLLVKKMTM